MGEPTVSAKQNAKRKRAKKEKKSTASTGWTSLEGWQAIDVGEDFLLGADEGGFAGLEELTPSEYKVLVGEAGEPVVLPTAAAPEPVKKRLKTNSTANNTAGKQLTAEPMPRQQTGDQALEPKETGKALKGKPQKKAPGMQGTQGERNVSDVNEQAKEQQAATSAPAAEPASAAEGQAGKKKQNKPGRKQRLKRKRASQNGAAEPDVLAKTGRGAASVDDVATAEPKAAAADDVQALLARVAQLEAENSKLRKTPQSHAAQAADSEAAASDEEPSEDDADEAPQLVSAGAGVAANAGEAAQLQGGGAPEVDMSAWAEFELHPLIEGALGKLGFTTPTAIQRESLIPAIRGRQDIIGAAQTGSGKTLAFGLPILQLLLEEREPEEVGKTPSESPLRALILAPTRELAMQVTQHLAAVGRECGVRVCAIVGGISPQKQERLLKLQPQVVVATPGRLWELMGGGQRHVCELGQLSFLVLDEADRMVQQGHFEELGHILDAIPNLGPRDAEAGAGDDEPEDEEEEDEELPQQEGDDAEEQHSDEEPTADGKRRARFVQTFVFSATLTLPERLRKRLQRGGGGSSGSSTLASLMAKLAFRGKPKIVDLTSERKLADKVQEAVVSCGEEERDVLLYYLLTQHPGRTLVFVNAISAVRRVAAILKLLGLPVSSLHAQQQQRQRLKALDRFRDNGDAVLVASDVAARGLDIKDVRCVVHYQLPASADVYVHRSGRTARAFADGLAIALVTPKEAARYNALVRVMGREPAPEFPVDAAVLPRARERVRLAVRLDRLLCGEKKDRAERSWRAQQAEALELQLSDNEEDSGAEQEPVVGKPTGKKSEEDNAAVLQKELASMLAEPLQPKFSSKFFTGGVAASRVRMAGPAPTREPAEGAGPEAAGTVDAGGAAKMSLVVQMAERMTKSRAAAAASVEAQKASDAKRKAKQKRKLSLAELQAQAQQAELARALGKKQRSKSKRSGLVVIPSALGRDARGPDALQVLRQKLGA